MKGAHGEPWRSYGDGVIEDAHGREVAHTGEPDGVRPNLNRIVDCVNACDGIEDPAAALAEVRRVLAAIALYADGAPAMEARRALSLLTPKV